jgi:hypothetical protein
METRTRVVSPEIAWWQEQHDWPGLAALGKITRAREIGREITTETAYYVLIPIRFLPTTGRRRMASEFHDRLCVGCS